MTILDAWPEVDKAAAVETAEQAPLDVNIAGGIAIRGAVTAQDLEAVDSRLRAGLMWRPQQQLNGSRASDEPMCLAYGVNVDESNQRVIDKAIFTAAGLDISVVPQSETGYNNFTNVNEKPIVWNGMYDSRQFQVTKHIGPIVFAKQGSNNVRLEDGVVYSLIMTW